MTARPKVVVVGAGMAGAGLAAEIADHAEVTLLEAEAEPGYHSTGRSAAFWSETYGGPLIQPLTTASHALLADPPAAFAERSFLHRRGAVHLARSDDRLAAAIGFAASGVAIETLGGAELRATIPGLRPSWSSALFEPTCSDIDVAALHQAYLRSGRKKKVRLVCDAPMRSARRQGGAWRIEAGERVFTADILVDAAGAWADEVAARAGVAPIGIQPFRRTLVQLRVSPPVSADLPLVIDADGQFYFKPEPGGRLWLSPHDETPSPPSDCAAEEIDVALAIERLQEVVDWRVEQVERKWAGLRSFAPDRLPVYGFAADEPGFFWCAGQGGFGIQTAPAASRLAAALLLGRAPPAGDPDPNPYLASRFTRGNPASRWQT